MDGIDRSELQGLLQLDLLRLIWKDWEPDGIHIEGRNGQPIHLSAHQFWQKMVTDIILPHLNAYCRLFKKHWHLLTAKEQDIVQEWIDRCRTFEVEFKAGNKTPRCILPPEGLEDILKG